MFSPIGAIHNQRRHIFITLGLLGVPLLNSYKIKFPCLFWISPPFRLRVDINDWCTLVVFQKATEKCFSPIVYALNNKFLKDLWKFDICLTIAWQLSFDFLKLPVDCLMTAWRQLQQLSVATCANAATAILGQYQLCNARTVSAMVRQHLP